MHDDFTDDMEELMQYLNYDPTTGLFTYTERRGRMRTGDIAGAVRKDTGIVELNLYKRKMKAHRVAVFAVEGELYEEDLITHKDGNLSNNAYSNLKKISRTTLCRTATIQCNNTTGYRGVSYNPNRKHPYIVRMRMNGKEIWIGSYDTIEEAITVRENAVADRDRTA